MAAAISRAVCDRLGLGLVDQRHEPPSIEFGHGRAGFFRSTAAREQFRQDQIRLRLIRLPPDGLLLDGACFGQSVVPGQDSDQQIKGVSFPNIDLAGAPQKFYRTINLTGLPV